jgi:hypothetical protein
MGLEFLVAGVIVPLAQRLGERWLDSLAQGIDEGLRSQLARLISAESQSDPERQRTARAELIAYAETNPKAQQQLVATARQGPQVAVQPGTEPSLAQLERFHALLVFVFDRVARLMRPVALPGFFNCTTCVAVIDARTEYSGIAFPEPPEQRSGSGSRWWIFFGDVSTSIGMGLPRMWIIRSPTDKDRDDLVANLEQRFTKPQRLIPPPEDLESQLLADLGAEFVTDLEHDWVSVRPRRQPAIPVADTSLSAQEMAREILNRMNQPDPAATDEFFAISDPAGVKLLRDGLEKVLQDRWTQDEDWRRALAEL